MFADLISDDIFRLETKRLWLRWPRAADAAAITAYASLPEVAQMTAVIPHPYPPGEAERFILNARADNAAGRALALAIVQKSQPFQALGIVNASDLGDGETIEVGYALAPAVWGRGYATEALAALVTAAFSLTPAHRLQANARVINPASRRVLEKCGFSYVDTGLDPLPARGGLHPCDRFVLTRGAWGSGKARRLPPMAQQRLPLEESRLVATAAAAEA